MIRDGRRVVGRVVRVDGERMGFHAGEGSSGRHEREYGRRVGIVLLDRGRVKERLGDLIG